MILQNKKQAQKGRGTTSGVKLAARHSHAPTVQPRPRYGKRLRKIP
ncbi:MAG: hypothetical protein SOU49_06980 [Sodaliphilus pleomorphus]|nr:hypothetical protein [Sodaliphilus pleomorphus]MDD7067211.1 hypothetical protein [Sodaliphilus pleomorphus]MDY2832468.1 hypothetical protein [Sodaliphilus pleomorphus]